VVGHQHPEGQFTGIRAAPIGFVAAMLFNLALTFLF
jgi:hypothetical protein